MADNPADHFVQQYNFDVASDYAIIDSGEAEQVDPSRALRPNKTIAILGKRREYSPPTATTMRLVDDATEATRRYILERIRNKPKVRSGRDFIAIPQRSYNFFFGTRLQLLH